MPRSGNQWELVPIFSGDYFKGNDAIVIQPLTSAFYEITYCPLTMTSEEKTHEVDLVYVSAPN